VLQKVTISFYGNSAVLQDKISFKGSNIGLLGPKPNGDMKNWGTTNLPPIISLAISFGSGYRPLIHCFRPIISIKSIS